MKESIKTNEIVITGQYLGVVEEFLPNKKSTYTVFKMKIEKLLRLET
ncbi:MAG: hypothetical protein ACTSR5_09390 [Promethearchaeota archaeon]